MNTKKSNPHSYWKYAFIVPTLLAILLIMNKPLPVVGQRVPDGQSLVENDEGMIGCRELLRAAKAGDQAKVAKLLETTAPDCSYYADGEPRSPLVAAARNGNLTIGKLLVEAQAGVEFHAAGDETPLMAAAKYGHLDFVKYLVAQGAGVNKTLRGDGTALITASQNGHLDVVRYLISQKAVIDQQVPGDGTALINAVKNNHYTTARLLLEYGADPYLHAPGDEYAMFHAQTANNRGMIDLLEQYAKEK